MGKGRRARRLALRYRGCGSLEELAAGAVADEGAVADLDFAADGDDGGAAFDRHPFEGVVVVVDVPGFDAHGAAIVGIVDDEIGITADGDGAFAGEETEEFCGARAGGIDEAIEIDATALDAVGVEKIDAIFDAGNAVGNVGEGVFAKELLLGVKGAVVGADGVDEAEGETVPERVLIAFFAKRWRQHVLHAFDARAFGERFIQKEMRKDGLDAQVDAALFGGEGGVEGFLAREVNNVTRSAGVFE